MAVAIFLGAVMVAETSGDIIEVFFAASAGCDAQDPVPCQDSPDELLWMVELNSSGMFEVLDKINVESRAPVWLTLKPMPGASFACLFVAVADKNNILSYKVSGSQLALISIVDSHGINPVHATVSSDGRKLLVANYHGPDDVCDSKGSGVTTFTIGDSCDLMFADSKPHVGSSQMKSRQCSSHMHSFTAGRGMLAFACDLGADLVFTYEVSPNGKLTELARTPTPPGTGPRHSVQHSTLPILYVVLEMGSAILVYHIEANGELRRLQMISTLSNQSSSKAAELLLSHDGSTLYASNRAFVPNKDTITAFSVLPDGSLRLKQQVQAPSFPRGMVLSQSDLLVVASQHSGTLQSFNVGEDGLLSDSGFAVAGPPTCAALSSPWRRQAHHAAGIST
eukprot:TRINITY_DN89789_c0_g1_i1.p1 TRINITY_DN89789_c0_g1~~TRINITY_DN89789_c0_g1_i1.p1  ORF type:complete len:422 (-),score=74.79 TRINITY_DN89789_c0_g1_i1:385-1566(-)